MYSFLFFVFVLCFVSRMIGFTVFSTIWNRFPSMTRPWCCRERTIKIFWVVWIFHFRIKMIYAFISPAQNTPRVISQFSISLPPPVLYVSICFAGNHEDENDHRMTAEGHTDIHVSSSYQTWECKQQPLMRWLIVHLNRILNAAQFSFFQLSLI